MLSATMAERSSWDEYFMNIARTIKRGIPRPLPRLHAPDLVADATVRPST